MNWHTIDETPPTAGEYLTATLSIRVIDPKSHTRTVRYMGRERVYFDGEKWAHNGFSHWREEMR